MKNLLFALFSIICFSLVAQDAPIFDEMIFESDSFAKAYKPTGKNFIILKSKRGADGMPKTSSGDSIKSLNITDIVLVFTENEASDLANREVANRERWENLIKTYPTFFKENPSLYNTCQCVKGGDAEALKKTQGFYIFIGGKAETPEPKVVAKKDASTSSASKVKEEKPKKDASTSSASEKVAKEEKVKEEKPKKEEKIAKEEKPKKEKKVKEEKIEEVIKKKEEPVKEEEVVAAPAPPKVKKAGFAKPKKAKDPKACRPPCYEGGDEGLNAFFLENVILSKKEKRHSDELVCKLRIQLNFDGTIKKTFITGANETLNKQVEDAVKNMDNWYACVVNGTTVKSDITLTLKYYPETHSIRPYETMIVPRPGPKCKCGPSDIDLFGE